MRRLLFLLFVLPFVATSMLVARELKPATLAAYDRYIAATEARLAGERDGRSPFFWIDQQPPTQRAALQARLNAGDVVLSRLETRDRGAEIPIDGGLIHHWVGTVLMPGVSLDRLVAFVQDYDRYPQVFAPLIPTARLERRTGDRFEVSMRTSVQKVITVVMDAEYSIDYQRLSPTRLVTTNVASRLFQVHDAGTPAERREPGDAAPGYLWRFRMYCAFEERSGGSLEQCESVSLTRPIPFALGWLVRPFVTGIPRDTIEFTLGQVRRALVR